MIVRELKFRAWLKDEKRMAKVHEVSFFDDKVFTIATIDNFYADDEFKLMQFTGLKDKNGKEVFEGDIITTPFEEDGMFVVYLNTTAGLYIKSLLSGNIQFIDDPGSLEELEELKAEIRQSIEIKGNIYENSELLEGNLNGLL